MSISSTQNYYVLKKPKIINSFKNKIGLFNKILDRQIDEITVKTIEKEIWEEIDNLIPQIPYIGGDEIMFTEDLINTTMGLAFVKVMKKYGYSTEEIAIFLFEVCEELFSSMSFLKKFFARFFTKMLFSFPLNRIRVKKVKEMAKRSQEGYYSENLVFKYIEGDNKEFDFGIDYLACPICKFWNEQGAEDVLPYICLYDYFSSEFSGSGLIRTKTLAEGFKKCDFRFKKGRKTENRQKTQIIKRNSLLKYK